MMRIATRSGNEGESTLSVARKLIQILSECAYPTIFTCIQKLDNWKEVLREFLSVGLAWKQQKVLVDS